MNQPSIEARQMAMKALEHHVGPNLSGWPHLPNVYFGMGVDVILEALFRSGYELTERK